MCDPVSATIAAVSAATTLYQGQEQRKAADAQGRAQDAATVQAQKQADLADQASNRVNAKQPDIYGLMSSNAMAAKGGVGGTMLTGPQGIDQKALTLGKSTLLGG